MFSLIDDLKDAILHYPHLRINEDNELSLEGDIDLLHPDNAKLIDTFSVIISFPKNFPFCFPKVVETSLKIDRIPDRHIFINDNYRLCFAVEPEERIKCRLGISTRWFLDKVLVPRLAEEFVVNNGGVYTHEFSHGALGNLEYYFKVLKTNRPDVVINYLNFIVTSAFPKHYEKCICNSGYKFKKCHRMIFEELRHLGTGYLLDEIHRIKTVIPADQPI